MKVTSPQEMSARVEDILPVVLAKFEDKFKAEEKEQAYYHLVITGEYPRRILDEVEKTYLSVGWGQVKCQTSSENGERPGLTGLRLYAKPLNANPEKHL